MSTCLNLIHLDKAGRGMEDGSTSGEGRKPPACVLLVAGLLPGCVGQLYEPTDAPSEPTSVDAVPPTDAAPPTKTPRREVIQSLPPTRFTRLTATEYRNTIRDLFGVEPPTSARFTGDGTLGPFEANTDTAPSELAVERYGDFAREIASKVATERLDTFLDDCPQRDEACARQFTDDLLRRAFRRATNETERGGASLIFTEARGRGVSFEDALQLVIEAVLQSPSFLYRVEPDGAPGGMVPLDGYALASRLSYFLWKSTPDEMLLDEAAAGTLESNLRLQAQRMLEDPKFRRTIADFHTQWLGVRKLPELSKNADTYPEYSPALARAMVAEIEQLAEHVFFSSTGKVSELFTSTEGFVTPELAQLYGIEPPVDAATPVPLPSTERSGALTRAAVLAVGAHEIHSSPTHRGIIVREHMLCQHLPPPPPDVDDTPPPILEGTTIKEQYLAHANNPACAGCHVLVDPLGFGLETYDAIGRWRPEATPFELEGEIVASDIDGTFSGPLELSERLAGSEQVLRCVAEQWFRYALVRHLGTADQAELWALGDGLIAASGDLRSLLLSIVETQAFRVRILPEEK